MRKRKSEEIGGEKNKEKWGEENQEKRPRQPRCLLILANNLPYISRL